MTDKNETKIPPNMLSDLKDTDFPNMPSLAVTTDDLVVAMNMKEYISFIYTRCNVCVLRRFGCGFYREHDNCQIERNLFREHLADLQRDGVDLRDKALVMASFIQLKELWRTSAKLSIYDEDKELGFETNLHDSNKEYLNVAKYLHKTITDHTKQLLRVLKELSATRKERQSLSINKKDIDSFSVFLTGLREGIDAEDLKEEQIQKPKKKKKPIEKK